MTPWSLARVNFRRFARRLVPLILLLAVGGGIVMGGGSITAGAQDRATDALRESDLRTIEVFGRADAPGSGLTADTVRAIGAADDVEAAEPVVQSSIAEEGTRTLFTSVNLRESGPPPGVDGQPAIDGALEQGEVLLPASAGDVQFAGRVGDTLTFSFTMATGPESGRRETLELTVVGVYEPGYQLDGPRVAYLSREDAVRFAAALAGIPAEDYEDLTGYDRLIVTATTSEQVDEALARLQADGWHAVSMAQRLGEVPGLFQVIQALSWVLLVGLCVLGGLAALSLTSALIRQRSTEVGILRAVGWTSRRVFALLLREMLLVCLAAGLVATAIGWATARLAGARLASLIDSAQVAPQTSLDVGWLALVIAATAATTLAGSWLPALRASRQDPLVALRDL